MGRPRPRGRVRPGPHRDVHQPLPAGLRAAPLRLDPGRRRPSCSCGGPAGAGADAAPPPSGGPGHARSRSTAATVSAPRRHGRPRRSSAGSLRDRGGAHGAGLHARGPRRGRPAAVPADRDGPEHDAGRDGPRVAAVGRARRLRSRTADGTEVAVATALDDARSRSWWRAPRCSSTGGDGLLSLVDAPGPGPGGRRHRERAAARAPAARALRPRRPRRDRGDPDPGLRRRPPGAARRDDLHPDQRPGRAPGRAGPRCWPRSGTGSRCRRAPAATCCARGPRGGVDPARARTVPAITRRTPELHHLEGFRLRLQSGGGRSMRFNVAAAAARRRGRVVPAAAARAALPAPHLEPAQRDLPRELLRPRRHLQPVRDRPRDRGALPAADPLLGRDRRVHPGPAGRDHGRPRHPGVVARPRDLALRRRQRLAAPDLHPAAVPGRPADLARLDAQADRAGPVRPAEVQDRHDPPRAVEVGRPAVAEPPQQRDPGVGVRLAPHALRGGLPAQRPAHARQPVRRATARRSARGSASGPSRRPSSTRRRGGRTRRRW